jgi:N-acetylglucosaminyldiphosphoundecaprenol N-acetyl-beta-D-mannosaminyltransferase
MALVHERAPCAHGSHEGERAKVNGVELDRLDESELVARVESFVRCGSSHVVHFFAAHPTVLARKDRAYRELVNRGDLNVPDGLPVAWALRLLGGPGHRIAGTDGFGLLCRAGVDAGHRHYLFGGTTESLERLRVRLETAYPGVRIVGAESPPFRDLDDDELRDVARRMRTAGSDLVWVGLGVPKQDLIAEQLRELAAARVIVCVGAAFDFLSGAQRRAPAWMQTTGTEWLFRLISEPKRLWRRYLVGNPQFVAGVAKDILRRARP